MPWQAMGREVSACHVNDHLTAKDCFYDPTISYCWLLGGFRERNNEVRASKLEAPRLSLASSRVPSPSKHEPSPRQAEACALKLSEA